jgi:hypothetical protein
VFSDFPHRFDGCDIGKEVKKTMSGPGRRKCKYVHFITAIFPSQIKKSMTNEYLMAK